MDKLEPTHKELELFEAYLMDTMDVAEKQKFGQQLSNDNMLGKKFQNFKQQVSYIEESALRSKLEEFHGEYENTRAIGPNRSGQSSKNLKKYMIAASIALIAALGSILFLDGGSTEKKLFDEHFSPDPGLPTVMGNNDNYAFYEAMVDYKQGNYGEAIKKWETLLGQRPNNDTLNYFLGVAYLATGEGHRSIGFLRKSLDTKNTFFKDDAHFYLGLAHLRTKNKNLAIENLKKSPLRKSKALLNELADGE